MKGIAFLVVCLCAVARANRVEEMSIVICEDKDCDCPPPQAHSMFTIRYMEDFFCYCHCGRLETQTCVEDSDCVLGFYCAAGDEHGGHGRCEDACTNPAVSCGTYEKCVVGPETGQPECRCKMYRCEDITIGPGVCAYDPVEKTHETFKNECLYANFNCARLRAKQDKLKKKPIGDCAVLDSMYRAPGALNAFEFDKQF